MLTSLSPKGWLELHPLPLSLSSGGFQGQTVTVLGGWQQEFWPGFLQSSTPDSRDWGSLFRSIAFSGNAALGKGFLAPAPFMAAGSLEEERLSSGPVCLQHPPPWHLQTLFPSNQDIHREGGREGGRRSERRGERTYADLRPQQLSRV